MSLYIFQKVWEGGGTYFTNLEVSRAKTIMFPKKIFSKPQYHFSSPIHRSPSCMGLTKKIIISGLKFIRSVKFHKSLVSPRPYVMPYVRMSQPLLRHTNEQTDMTNLLGFSLFLYGTQKISFLNQTQPYYLNLLLGECNE